MISALALALALGVVSVSGRCCYLALTFLRVAGFRRAEARRLAHLQPNH